MTSTPQERLPTSNNFGEVVTEGIRRQHPGRGPKNRKLTTYGLWKDGYTRPPQVWKDRACGSSMLNLSSLFFHTIVIHAANANTMYSQSHLTLDQEVEILDADWSALEADRSTFVGSSTDVASEHCIWRDADEKLCANCGRCGRKYHVFQK